jgi:hypothetical protein
MFAFRCNSQPSYILKINKCSGVRLLLICHRCTDPEAVSLSEKLSRDDGKNLSPVTEAPSSEAVIAAGGAAISVTRSRTLPSRRTPTTPNAREPRQNRGAAPGGHHRGAGSEGSGSEAARTERERDSRRVLHKKNRRTSAQPPSSSS